MSIIGFEEITSNCPQCGYSKENVEYYNCGPIRYIKCPKCNYVMKESTNAPIGKLFDTWNRKAD